MNILINDVKYEVIENYKDAIDSDLLKEKITDYFHDFDYVLGDWAYGKLRLKGFNDKNNKNFKPINDYKKIDEYIKNNCAYDCRYFILKRIKSVEK